MMQANYTRRKQDKNSETGEPFDAERSNVWPPSITVEFWKRKDEKGLELSRHWQHHTFTRIKYNVT